MKPTKGICVDAGTIGNPGICFYRGLDLETGRLLFEANIGMGTNNIAEFLACVHAIYYVKSNNIKLDIYSDSLTAIAWVKHKKVKTTFKGEILKRLLKACDYLIENNTIQIKKWETTIWGEIPADYGRK
jgi:ribonuclease HI